MSRVAWWASGANRRIPVAAAAGVAVVLPQPHRNGGGWAMAETFATAARAVGDTTLTLSTRAEYNSAEAWATLRVTANRLIGLHFSDPQGRTYRITAHSGAAALTFARADGTSGGLGMVLDAESSPIRIQSDLPPILAYLLLQTTGADIQWQQGKVDAIATDFSTIFNGTSEAIIDNEDGIPARPLRLISAAAATTAEIRCFSA